VVEATGRLKEFGLGNDRIQSTRFLWLRSLTTALIVKHLGTEQYPEQCSQSAGRWAHSGDLSGGFPGWCQASCEVSGAIFNVAQLHGHMNGDDRTCEVDNQGPPGKRSESGIPIEAGWIEMPS